MKKLILLLLLLGNMCMLNAQTVYPPSKPNHIDGSIPSSLLFTWKEGKPASSKEIKYDNGSPIASSQLTSPYRLDQTLFAVRFTTAENTTIERIHAYISFFNEASATFTVRIVGMDENELPDMNNVKATFTQTASVPNYGISSWVELCPSSQISINAQDTIFVVLTANKDVRLHNDIEGSGQGTSFMKRNLDTYFMDIENATMRNANWMIRLQTNHTLASAPSKLDGYNFYKNGTKLNTSLISVPQYQENGISTGSYNYTVKAVYGGAETQASEVLSLNYKATIVYTFENLATGEIPEGCIIIDGNNDNFKLSAQMGGVGGAASYTGSMFLGTSAAKLLD